MTMIFLDGEFLDEAEAKVVASDRGVLFGDGVYTTLLVEEGKIYFLEDHLKKLEQGCAFLKITYPQFDKGLFYKLLESNQAFKGTWRLKILITGGKKSHLSLPLREKGHLIFTLNPFLPPTYQPLHLTLYPTPVMVPHAHFKSLSSLHRLYVMDYAEAKNKDDAITLTESGHLLEGAYSNLFWVSQNRLYTPDPALPLYFGVTLSKVLEAAEKLGLKISFVKTRLIDIPESASLFRVNTLRGIRPIGKIDERIFPRSLMVEKGLLKIYAETKKRQGWIPLPLENLR